MEMKNKKAILVWSDGIETNYTEYTSTPDKTAVEQAQDQMHKEYQEHGEADEECGAFEGDMECYFAAEDQDSCRWTIIPVSEDEVVGKNKGCFVVTNIEWNTDGDQKILDTLPKEVVLLEKFDLENYLDKDRLLDDVSDWLSAEYGYCHSIMSKDRWEVLRNCVDFQEIYDCVFNKYGVEDYCSILDKIEDELETYENSSSEKWQEAVENGNIPDSIQWFCGMIDTEYFLNECWI